MKVISSQQVARFTAGDALSPTDLNDVFLYAKDALADVTEKRYALSAITFTFVGSSTGAGIGNALSVGERTQRFTCPVACTVVRAFLDANLTAGADVTVAIKRAVTAVVPTGGTIPYLSVASGATTAADVNDVNTQSVTLDAGVSYDLIVEGTSFTTERFNVTLHVKVDRWRAGGALAVPDFAFSDFTDGLADATLVGSGATAATVELTTAVAGLTARAMSPAVVVAVKFDNTTLASGLLRVLPVPAATRCASRIVRAYLTSAVAATTPVVTAVLKNAAGTTVATLTNSHVTDLLMTADSGALALTLNGGVELLAEDFTVEFSSTTGTIVQRAALILWFEW